jgi:hypothetical protein
MHTIGTVLTCGRIPDHLERGRCALADPKK